MFGARAKPILLWVMAAFYILSGFNHLVNPEFYLAIFPPNLPNPEWLNVLSGLAEIILGVFLLEPRTRVFAAWGIIASADRGVPRESDWRCCGEPVADPLPAAPYRLGLVVYASGRHVTSKLVPRWASARGPDRRGV